MPLPTVVASTELEAVNHVLRNMGEAEVNTLTGTQVPPEAAEALKNIRQISKSLQKRGWYFNRHYETLTPDVNDNISLPVNVLAVRSIDEDRNRKVTKRGNTLYNMTPYEHGTTFTANIKCEVIYGLEFSDLPESARDYITHAAARKSQIQQESDQLLLQEDTNDEQRAWAELMAEQLAAEPMMLTSEAVRDVNNLQYRGGY